MKYKIKKEKEEEKMIDGKIMMSKVEFIKEHKNLVRILRTGTSAEQLKEADNQEEELSEYL